jgi:hypothetical protein
MPTARQHHFLPQFYLKGFAKQNGKVWQTWALDLKQKRQFQTNIKKVATIRDFNRIDVDGQPPDAIEQALSSLETDFANVFAEIIKNKSLPINESLNVLFNFIALIAVRNPQFRNQLQSFHDKIARTHAQMLVSDKKVWDSTTARAKAQGVKLDESVSYEDIKAFVESDAYDVKISPSWQLDLELTGVDAVLGTLSQRKWTLIQTDDHTHGFICCDRPVSLRWMPDVKSHPFYGPGFASTDTLLIMPLTHNLALVGSFEHGRGSITVEKNYVAEINTSTLLMADRQVYSREQIFFHLTKDMTIATSGTLVSSNSK